MPLPSLTRAARLAPVVLCAALAGCEVEVSGLSAVGDLAFEVREVHPPFNYAAGRDPQLAVLLGPDAGVPCGLRTELGIGEGVITVHVLGIDRTIVCAG
ncbi:MAG TPA: hypothetical protein VNA89_14720, partial [Gemmatimonadaceae bacterium]|nr:hypothetical protein [Gemmatimonadaceae bacterium]